MGAILSRPQCVKYITNFVLDISIKVHVIIPRPPDISDYLEASWFRDASNLLEIKLKIWIEKAQ